MELKSIVGKKYEITEKLNSSKINDVAICRHKELGTEWIIKSIPRRSSYKNQELKHLLLMEHPRIPVVIDVIHDHDKTFFVISKMKGICLQDMCSCRETTGHDILKWFKELTLILQHVHAKGVTHGDLKPENIIVDEDFGVSIIDFGSSFISEDSRSFTWQYAAPERLLDNYKSDDRSDLYSLGVLMEVCLKMLQKKPKLKMRLHFNKIIKCCKKINPENRFYSTKELFDALCTIK